MSANGISRLEFKRDRQLAKLALASTNRSASGRRATVVLTQLPTLYAPNDNNTNNVIINPRPEGAIIGRPWILSPAGPTPIQLLQNDEFNEAQPTQTAWVSAVGWGGNDKPNLGGGILIFTYIERTVSQTVDISDYGNYTTGTLDFAVARHPAKTDAQNIYYILVRFLNASNEEIGTYRYPAVGDANTNGSDFYAISEEFSLPAGAIAKAEVNVVARETGFWAGQYGPKFDYVRLTLS